VPQKRRVKVQVICGVGMGSSLMAKMTIDAVAKELGVDISSEVGQPSTAGLGKIDIIATTPFLADKLGNVGDAKIVVFTNFVSKKHIRERFEPALREVLEEIEQGM
jgi:PTS system ascorbate-specific IIB component